MKYWWVLPFVGFRMWLALTFPPFNDESIYAEWARFIGTHFVQGLWPVLMDGKQPGLMIVWSWFIGVGNDPILILRITSIGFGLITALLIFSLYRRLTGKEMDGGQRLLYLLIPGLVWYESLGLQESAVMCIATALVYWSIRQFDKSGWSMKQGIFLAVLLGLGIVLKPTAIFTLGAVFLATFICWKRKPHLRNRIAVTLLAGLLVMIGISQIISLHPGYAAYVTRMSQRQAGLLLLAQQPALLLDRLWSETVWLAWWHGPLWLFCLGYGGFLVRKLIRKETFSEQQKMILVIMTGGLSVVLASLGSGEGIFTSRYIAGAFPLISLVGLVTLEKVFIKSRGKRVIRMWTGFITGVLISMPLTVFQTTIKIPAVHADLAQYMTGWTSGWGVRESIKVIEREIGAGRGIVLIRADSGNPESAVNAYFWKHSRIRTGYVEYAGELLQQPPLQNDIPIYFVSRGTQMGGLTEAQVQLIAKFDKPLDEEFVGVWKVVR